MIGGKGKQEAVPGADQASIGFIQDPMRLWVGWRPVGREALGLTADNWNQTVLP